MHAGEQEAAPVNLLNAMHKGLAAVAEFIRKTDGLGAALAELSLGGKSAFVNAFAYGDTDGDPTKTALFVAPSTAALNADAAALDVRSASMSRTSTRFSESMPSSRTRPNRRWRCTSTTSMSIPCRPH